ncbi:uncharacterized protein M421DRAFT_854 [Didymella exigua CBS 183.55]|uniref:Uncharacterized protein n=1 Tax=Didymella exigua CBS 183.55 TaxID=1150837 RepID=A0A6A5RY68_9PLEO|nr:uncharacterized protein M421DRAFT_854 [Didymella exigua CBS 183.55]KAF1933445.1 hypothetical protein M421DRAFT_854 [Didymella exigua CBS 183.55]
MATKECSLCHTLRGVLVRCQIDESGKWNFVCPGKCWHSVSGGIEDAKGLEGLYPYYRYGGMWKDRNADGPTSAKKPRRVKERQRKEEAERQAEQNAQLLRTAPSEH